MDKEMGVSRIIRHSSGNGIKTISLADIQLIRSDRWKRNINLVFRRAVGDLLPTGIWQR